MPTANDLILEGNLRHLVGVRRLGSSLAAKATHLLGQTEKELKAEIEKRTLKIMAAVQAGKDPVGIWTLDRLKALRADMAALRRESFGAVGAKLPEELFDLAGYEVGFQEKLLSNAIPFNVSWTRPSHHQLKAILTRQPFGGQGEQPSRLLSKWVKSIEVLERTKIDATLRQGLIQGQTIRQMTGRVQAITAQSRAHAEAVTRTAVTHVSNAARGLLYKANTDVIKGELFVATLDERTTLTCAGLDGTEWDVGTGPVPPLHVNCRSTRTPITKSWKELGMNLEELPPGQRPYVVQKMTGNVPSTTNFTKWLRGQPIPVQDDWMGPARAKIFRANPEMSLRDFLSTVDHRPLTLAQLAEKEGLVILDILADIPKLKSMVAVTKAAIAESNIIKAAAEAAAKQASEAAEKAAAEAAAKALEIAKKQKLSDAAKKAAATKAAKKAATIELDKQAAAAELAAKQAAEQAATQAVKKELGGPNVLFESGTQPLAAEIDNVPVFDAQPGWWDTIDEVPAPNASDLVLPMGPEIKRRVGVVIIEPDGRIWMRTLGEQNRLIGGEVAEISQREAMRLAWEQTGLQTRIVDELGDTFDNGTSTRWYMARRTGGNPWNNPSGTSLRLRAGEEAVKELNLGTHKYMAFQARGILGEGFASAEYSVMSELDALYGVTAQYNKIVAYKATLAADAKLLEQAMAEQAKKEKLSNAAKKAAATKKANKLAEKQAASHAGVKTLDGSKWTQTAGQAGSNPGARFLAPDGVEWYVKYPKQGQGLERLQEELAANRLYRRAGIKVPELELVEINGQMGIASRIVPGKVATISDALTLAKAGDVKEGFIFDAWMGNWDVAGAKFDNLLVDDLGKVYRIDVGGSLRYRAQGALKQGWGYSDEVSELDTLRDMSMNPNTAKIFSNLTDAELRDQIKYLQSVMSDDVLMAVLDSVPNLPDKQDLFERLQRRRDWLIKWAKQQEEAAAKLAKRMSAPLPGDLIDASGAHEFVHESQAISWADAQFAKWDRSLTIKERESISIYTGSSYHDMNGALRKAKTIALNANTNASKLAYRGLERAEVDEAFWVFRGTNTWPELDTFIKTATPGDTFTDWGFTSTAITQDRAWPGNVGFKILLPKGYKGAAWVKNMSRHQSELEVLLNSGTRFRLRSLPKKVASGDKYAHKGWKWIVELEVIP